MTRRQKAVAGIVCAAVLLAAIPAYVWRERLLSLWPKQATTAQDALQTAPPAVSADVARGDITIDPQRQQLIGVRLAPVSRETLSDDVRTTGVVRYDETRQADVNVKLDGWIRQLYVDYTGQFIEHNQPLFALYSPDLLAAQHEYLLALRNRDQLKGTAVADAAVFADRVVDAARQRLTLWDLAADDIAALESGGPVRDAITFRSPVSGYVIEKAVVQGMHVAPGQTLYKVADLSSVWIEADVYEQDLSRVRVGQRASVTLNAYPGETFEGRAIYVFSFVDEKSRTVKVRFQFPNARGRLKPGMYANVQLRGASGRALTIPANAALDSGTQQVVFVASGEGLFSPRPVKLGRRTADRVEVLEGLKEGEQVATSATFFLDSESQLRAGLQNYEAAPSAAGTTAASALDITFRSDPDPPKTGESAFRVTVKDAGGQPVIDAEVGVLQFMPAMPTMNMPAMRSETRLPHVGAGAYQGPAQVMMAGRWDVTVTVRKNGQELGRKQFAMVAR